MNARRVGVDVVRAERVEVGVARRRDVDHRRDVELHERLVEREPVLVGERPRRPVPAGRVGIEVAADEPELLDAAAELRDRVVERAVRASAAAGTRRRSARGRARRRARRGRCTRAPRRRRWRDRATWCSIAEACGEKTIRSAPRSRSMRSWFCSTLSRISSSEIRGGCGSAASDRRAARAARCGTLVQLRRRGRVVAVDVDDHRRRTGGPSAPAPRACPTTSRLSSPAA